MYAYYGAVHLVATTFGQWQNGPGKKNIQICHVGPEVRTCDMGVV
jgi:hypothetical protein